MCMTDEWQQVWSHHPKQLFCLYSLSQWVAVGLTMCLSGYLCFILDAPHWLNHKVFPVLLYVFWPFASAPAPNDLLWHIFHTFFKGPLQNACCRWHVPSRCLLCPGWLYHLFLMMFSHYCSDYVELTPCLTQSDWCSASYVQADVSVIVD